MIYTPNIVSLPSDAPIKRYPPRKPSDRQDNYLKNYDFLTVFSDVFVKDGTLWMIGPKWENLEEELKASKFRWNWTDISTSITFESLNRMSRAYAHVPDSSGVLEIDGPLGHWEVEVPNIPSDLNEDRNVLVTQQQDNRLEWIAYWAFYNVNVNAIDTVVIYDNASTLYPPERVDQVLSMIPGLKSHMVVRWNMPYGPTGGPNNVWDSDYSQHVAWEHSRRFFTQKARSALMIDIDELPIHVGGESLPEVLANTDQAVLHFNRQPIRPFPNRSDALTDVRVHSDYSLGEERGAWLAPKYIFAPARIVESDQLMAHVVRGQDTTPLPETEAFAGHFDAIRIRWRLEEKRQVPNFKRPEDIVEPTVNSTVFSNKFDQLANEWKQLQKALTPIVNSQAEPHWP
ncbi:hypothetical protein INS43_03270 [Corynebacterium aurimucosum]|uniref:hypothetical protein n=1 Tax=Corynebacterium TaxID=1716 RepID=UPI0008A1C558|nr:MULTISPECIES: hypothetical protein [Corynebacterium]MBE7364207.1 hypothetical protein [Corynebacterium aurimucosum]OFS40621.1 hypothetical protein HMPREF2896_03035 [Corynebacterium sp. HMSC069E04]